MEYHSRRALWWCHCILKWLWQGRTRVAYQIKRAPGQLLPTSPHVQPCRLLAFGGVSRMLMIASSLTKWNRVLVQWHKHGCQTATSSKMMLTPLEDTSKPRQCSIPMLIYASGREYQSECYSIKPTHTCATQHCLRLNVQILSMYIRM